MLPLETLNRLRLGREVAAEVHATLPGHKAWILVWPREDPEHGYFTKLSDYGECIIVSISGENPLRGYEIIYTEIEQQALQEALEHHCEIPYSMAVIERDDFAKDELELETKLSLWLTDLSLLRIPSEVQYPFT